MEHNCYQGIYLDMAPIHTSLADNSAVAESTKFALDFFQTLAERVQSIFKIDASVDARKLATVALTATEYYINFIRFSLSASTGLRSLSINAINLAQSNTLALEKWLQFLGTRSTENDARALRTETCFRDVISSMVECRQPRKGGPTGKRAETVRC